MKRILLIIILWLPVSTIYAQGPPDTSFDFNTVDTSVVIPFDSLSKGVFGDLDTSKMGFRLLYDIVPTATNLPHLQGEVVDTPCSLGDFLNACMEYNIANLWGQPVIDIADWYVSSKITYLEDNVVPIGIFYYSFDKIKPDAIANGWLTVGSDGRKLEDVLGANPYEQMDAFIMSPTLDQIVSTSFSFKIDSRFFFSNKNLEIDEIIVDFDDGFGPQSISKDIAYPVNYGEDGIKNIEIELRLTDETVLYSHARLNILESSEGTGDWDWDLFNPRKLTDFPPDETENICVLYQMPGAAEIEVCGKYGIWYGCGNDGLRKPVIISSGFDPFNLKRLYVSLRGAPLYDSYNGVDMNSNNNGNNLLERLRNEGYDIIILDYDNGTDYMQANAALLSNLMVIINNQVVANGSKHEAVVMGFSAGALNARLSLSQFEYYHQLNPSNPHHHSWKYVSFDGEHQGANTPLGLQYYLFDVYLNGFPTLLNPLGALPAILGVPSFMNPTAQQMLFYHLANSNSTNAYPHPDKNTLFTYMNSFAPSTGGYPSGTRNIAVAQGSSNGLDLTGCCFNAGANLFNYKVLNIINPFTGTFARTKFEYNAIGTSNHVFKVASEVKWSWFNSWVTVSSGTYHANNALPVDNPPGSVTAFHRGSVKPPILFDVPILVDVNYLPTDESFVPTISALDVRNGSVSNLGTMVQPLSLDVRSLLFYNGTSVSGPFTINNNSGYPHLGLTNPKLYTPFDAMYSHYNANTFHITNPMLGTGNFLVNEIAPFHLKLQNRIIGNTEPYKAAFEARLSIQSGDMVTWTTPFDNYIVDQYGDVDFRAGQYIQLDPGFQTVLGSSFYAYIQSYPCSQKLMSTTTPSSSFSSPSGEEIHMNPLGNTVSSDEIYPNPSSGIFYLLLNEKESIASIEVIDMIGKKYTLNNWSLVNSLITFDLSHLNDAVYVINIHFQNGESISKKVIKQ